MTKVAAVKFKNTEKSYFYACELENLNQGDKLEVEAPDGTSRKVRFVGYASSDLIGFVPKLRVLRLRTDETVTVVRKNISKRTGAQIEADTVKLAKFLEANRPTAMTSTQIAEFMGWSEKAATSNIRTSMRRNSQIINYDHNLYTVRHSDQAKYKFATEVN